MVLVSRREFLASSAAVVVSLCTVSSIRVADDTPGALTVADTSRRDVSVRPVLCRFGLDPVHKAKGDADIPLRAARLEDLCELSRSLLPSPVPLGDHRDVGEHSLIFCSL